MKKFCSSCGNGLELSQRHCTECGAVNPFFVPAFSLLEDQSNDVEKLRLEKERIEKELADKLERQAEFMRQEQLRMEEERQRKENELAEKLEQQAEMLRRDKLKRQQEDEERNALEEARKKKEQEEIERLQMEKMEKERSETELRKEIERMRGETEQYKKETLELLKKVRDEIQTKIETEGGVMAAAEKEMAELKTEEETEIASTPVPVYVSNETKKAKAKSFGTLEIFLLGLVVIIGAGLFVYILNRFNNHEDSPVTTNAKPDIKVSPAVYQVPVADTVAVVNNPEIEEKDVPVKEEVMKAEITPVANKPETKKAEKKPVSVLENKTDAPLPVFVLTVSKIKRDIAGRKLSGCDITIGDVVEIQNLSNVVLVERLEEGGLKYKASLTVKQNGETFTSIPYLYYSDEGHFLNMDGTNCE